MIFLCNFAFIYLTRARTHNRANLFCTTLQVAGWEPHMSTDQTTESFLLTAEEGRDGITGEAGGRSCVCDKILVRISTIPARLFNLSIYYLSRGGMFMFMMANSDWTAAEVS